ncbi:SRPBCC family protein [Tsuneonella sp. YG55]|uniref:SRPBCC family protein n=1 Tax=Tsuneonella litorea TaxID=2976475 RepID=A0A9X2W205_9SPHN|nr:SRPBCC family protein [Tsuneonella litorea]MCT2559123.1 SRPBCC family protein [Tsuneonella litorea]
MHYLSVLALACACLASPAAAEVVETSGDHFVTRDEAIVKAAPRATWLALISPGNWWDDDHTWSGEAANMSITPQGGGCFCERIPEVETPTSVGLAGSAQHMTVVLARPETVLRMRGGLGPLQSEPVDGVLTITLQPDKASGGTKIVWEYVVGGTMRFPVERISKAVDGVMSQQLAHLADKLGRAEISAASSPSATSDDATPALAPTEVKDADEVAAELDKMGRKDD